MTSTKKNRLECEQYDMEIHLEFWKRQQEQARDMDYWHYSMFLGYTVSCNVVLERIVYDRTV